MRNLLVFLGLMVCAAAAFGSFAPHLTIGTNANWGGRTPPYFTAIMDAGGYSDGIYYGQSEIHEYGYHEVLSGEWGAAISYDNIDTELINPGNPEAGRKTMWLTKQFDYPNWGTNSKFQLSGIGQAWADPNGNPAPLADTGRSVISNGIVEITIDYEVVDMQFRDPNHYSWRGVLGYLDPDRGNPAMVESDRYCFLETYTIRNIDPGQEPVTNIEFYQLLHSHGADEYHGAVNSTYTDVPLDDPLRHYTPYSPVHQVGDFRYDLTQWNSTYGSAHTVDHTDFVTFSCVREPNWVDNDVYPGGHSYHAYKPPVGTHIHIEERNLNGVDSIFYDEVCGAMGWALGSLDPNETVSLTVAFLVGTQQEGQSFIDLTMTSDLDPQECISPGEEVTLTICWTNTSELTATDARLVCYLPAGLWYEAGWPTVNPNFGLIPGDPNYSQAFHTYTWMLGDVDPNEGGCVSLTLSADYRSEPGMTFTNQARFISTNLGTATVELDMKSCCAWGGDVIYVSPGAVGYSNGISWQHAYTDLRKALDRADEGCGAEIWVAQGVYDPGRMPETVFTLPANVALYGGFAGNETARDQRNPNVNKTILTGSADFERNNTVVKMGQNSSLDGFVVTGSAYLGQGIYVSGVDCVIANCTIYSNLGYGLRAVDGDVSLKLCTIRNNFLDGIRHDGAGSILTAENCWFRQNARHGVYSLNATPIIRNSIISESDLQEAGNEAIRTLNPTYQPVLQNVTVSHNKSAGIFFVDNGTVSDPNGKDWPDLQNCIIYHNGGPQLAGFSADDTAWYSCIQDCNDVNFNISVDPEFAYFDPNNMRLSHASPCKDAGSPLLDYEDQLDMDGRVRVLEAAVDIGAYEIDCEDTSNDLDWNADGRADYGDFAAMATVWKAHDPNDPALYDPNEPCYECVHDPNSPAYVQPAHLALWFPNAPRFNISTIGCSEYAIDFSDMIALVDSPEWLVWQACWLEGGSQMMLGGEGMFFVAAFEEQVTTEPPAYKQIGELASIILQLEEIWLTDPAIHQEIDASDWQGFMTTLYDNLLDLYMSTQ
jgi:uncharacterized repeat protein (TIGR01451 family)